MWSDHESIADYIDYHYLVNTLTRIINNDQLLPCSIGIYGDWGSGKSSLMRMVEQAYDEQKDVLVIKFNGWLFEGYEDAKTVLLSRIVDEIIEKRTLSEKAFKLANKLLHRINWIKVAGATVKYGAAFLTAGPVGVAAVEAHEAIAKLKEVDYQKYVADKNDTEKDPDDTLRHNIQEFHRNFEELIAETNLKKIIVFIDDLDRCSPDTIIGTLEAIKLFLFTINTAFVIGADERLIKYAVRRRFPEVPGENLEIGRDYLEKLIQYPVRIPPLSTGELTTYINLLLSKLYCGGDFEVIRGAVITEKRSNGYEFVYDLSNYKDFFSDTAPELDDAIALCAQIVPVLAVGLNGNPRQVKRFLNTLLIRLQMAETKGAKLKKRVMAKLMLLEYFKPETFTSFHDQQAANGGKLPVLAILENPGEDALTPEQKLLTDDHWIADWLASDPKLASENLQPYFYVSRDKLGVTTSNLQRMSPKSQDVIQKLLSNSQALKTNAIKEFPKLSSSDAASIFEALADKIRQGESGNDNTANLKSIFDLVREKSELKSQLITFLQKQPEGSLPLSIVPLTESLLKDSDAKLLKELLTKWAGSGNTKLVAVAKKSLE